MDNGGNSVNSECQDRVNELFADALEQPLEERRAFVESAGEKLEVRNEVLRMLDDEEKLGGFMGVLPVFELELEEETPTPRSFSDGEVVAGRYRIERLIKAGGMGEVYEAFDSKLNQRIALKTILPDIAGQGSFHARFRREVTLARTVTNANVCRVFDFGEHTSAGDRPEVCFLTIEDLSGETLRERLKRCGQWS